MLYSSRLRYASRFATVGGLGIILVSLARWGGTARPGPLFVLGVAVLASLLLTFGLLIAWLFHGPSPANTRTSSASFRLTISALALCGSAAFTLGFFWDELWHRRFGGFGDDFLWPPHLLIYVSIGLFALFAGGGLMFTLRGRPGTIRDRLRTESQVSLVALAATFLIVSLPSDELWHRIYGKDITAWSLPHITLATGMVLVTLGAASLATSITPRSAGWLPLNRMQLPQWISISLISIATITLLQFGVSEWEGITTLHPEGGVFRTAFWQRPVWLYPVIVTSIALFSSNFALYTLRGFGTATCVAILVLLFRIAGLRLLGTAADHAHLTYTAQLCLIAPGLVLDLWYAIHRNRANMLDLLIGNFAASIALLLVGLPLIDHFLLYPPITTSTLPPMVLMSLVMGQAAGWSGARFGAWVMSLDTSSSYERLSLRSSLITMLGLGMAFTVTISILLLAQLPKG